MILTSLEVDPVAFERETGWAIKPQGACKGELCVPLLSDTPTDAHVLAERLGMPLVHDPTHELWALGPATVAGKAIDTAVAPDLTLPDHTGAEFRLSSLRGQKVLLLAWASW